MNRILKGIDRLSEWSGKAVSWLVLLLIAELVYETLSRYFFGKPTKWSYDITYMLYGTLFMIGTAYTLLLDQHIRVELFHEKFSLKTRRIIEIICYLVLFFPAMILLLYRAIDYTVEAWKIGERCRESYWAPPIYPYKTVLPIALLFLLLQGVAQFVRQIESLRRKGDDA